MPQGATLADVTILKGEIETTGEVVPRKEANSIYEEERSQGRDAGVANRNGYQNFEFKISNIPAQQEAKIRLAYYQALQVDNGVGKYLYPLDEGGTNETIKNFWTLNSKVENYFSAQINVRMAVPIGELRIPGFENVAQLEKLADDHHRIILQQTEGSLNKDIVVYYRLADNLPARLELLPYRPEEGKPGSFMMVLTPGLDLKPLAQGSDYTFVLDTSGSMMGKIFTLAQGIKAALGQLQAEDRFRVIAFNDYAHELLDWTPASKANVEQAISRVESLQATGSTNLYSGIATALEDLDADRVSSIVLVTDGVTNTGIIDPSEFESLMQKNDVRIFGFLMGNSANWPLMRLICETSGGFYSAISNSDDIVGQLLLAKSKITSEAIHNAKLSISGVKVSDTTKGEFRKIYRGQQLVIFGRYENGGSAKVKLDVNMSGEDRSYETNLIFPQTDVDYPEVERLWAMSMVEDIEQQISTGKLPNTEGSKAIESIGVTYQIVTDETSMLVLTDKAFNNRGIARNNQARLAVERAAQSRRFAQPVRNNRADSSQPLFGNSPASHILSGGGAIDPISAIFAFFLFGLGGASLLRKR